MNTENMNNGYPFGNIDILEVISLILALQNLYENRQQSAHNDVQKANQEQEAHLMQNLQELFEEQNEMLQRIERKLDVALRGENRPG